MKALYQITALVSLLLAGGCASLQSVSVTNIPRERGRPIEASADNPAFLGIHFDNSFADDLPDDLRRQCPNGKVTGIYSKYESTWYVLVQNREITVHGYCVADEHPAAAPPAAPPSAAPPVAPVAPVAPPAGPPPTEGVTTKLEPAR